MKFKEAHHKDQLEQSCTKLQAVAAYADSISMMRTGKELVITRVWDTVAKESGVHRDRRAFDARAVYWDQSGEMVRYYTDDQAEFIAAAVNKRFPRSDKYEVCIYHSVPGSTPHLHFQIPWQWAQELQDGAQLAA